MIALAAALAVTMQGQPGDSRPLRLSPAQRDRIARHCHVPRSWLRLREGGRLHLKPPPTARYQDVDCVLQALPAPNGPPTIFIGNEQP